jgi:hypothetical protein
MKGDFFLKCENNNMDVDVGASKDNNARILSFAYNDAS